MRFSPSKRFACRCNHSLDRLSVRKVSRIQRELGGSRINFTPGGKQLRKRFPRVGRVEEGTFVVSGNPLKNHVLARSEPDYKAEFAHDRAVLFTKYRSATGGDHAAVEMRDGLERCSLEIAKGRLTLLLEDLRDLFVGAFDNELIRIEELKPQPACELPADARLSAAHKTDEDDILAAGGGVICGHGFVVAYAQPNEKRRCSAVAITARLGFIHP